MDPDLVIGSSLDRDNILPLGRRNVSGSCVVTGHHQDLKLWPQTWAYMLSFMSVQDLDFSSDPRSNRTRGPTWSLAAAGFGCHHCPQQHYGPKMLTWTLIFTGPVMVTGESELSMDPGCRRADKVLSCSSGTEGNMSLSSSEGHSGLGASWSSDSNLDPGDWFGSDWRRPLVHFPDLK